MDRRRREGVEGRDSGRDPHPGVRREPALQPGQAGGREARRDHDPGHKVAHGVGEDIFHRLEDAFGGGVSRLDRDDMARHRVAAPRRRVAEPGERDQVGELALLDLRVPRLRRAALAPAPEMPTGGGAHRHQKPAARLHPVAKLGVLAAIALERLVEAAGLLEERPGDAEIVAGHGPEQVVAARGHLPGAGHVVGIPGRVARPVREQRRRARDTDIVGVDACGGMPGSRRRTCSGAIPGVDAGTGGHSAQALQRPG